MRLGTIPSLKIHKKGVQIGPKLKRGSGTQEGHSALLEWQSTHEKCQLAQMHGPALGPPDWDKTYLFGIFRDKDVVQFVSDLIQHSNLYK